MSNQIITSKYSNNNHKKTKLPNGVIEAQYYTKDKKLVSKDHLQCCATYEKRQQDNNIIEEHKVLINTNTQMLCDPWELGFSNSKVDFSGLNTWKWILVKKITFDAYIKFLETHNTTYLKNAQSNIF
jgi:hypothetical protein